MMTPTEGMVSELAACSSITRSYSWNCPTTSIPVLTSLVSCKSEEKTRISSWLTSVRSVITSPATFITVPVTPSLRPPTTFTWSPCSKYFSSSSMLNSSFCLIASCRGRTITVWPSMWSTSPSKSLRSPPMTRTTSPLFSTIFRLWIDVKCSGRTPATPASSSSWPCSNILSSSSSGWTSEPRRSDLSGKRLIRKPLLNVMPS
mmetsp:Transcript_34058/g.80338  ORF Transcript_34058/g.80338 Transcript_34058/m.80338 type:complete len:203 (-) Transcript_34058:1208-1816(-)